MKRFLLVLILLLVVSVAVALFAAYSASGGSPLASHLRVLAVDLSGPLPDYAAEPTLPFGYERTPSLADLYLALKRAEKDESVQAVAVRIASPTMGLAVAQEVRRLLADMGAAGKHVECYAESFGEGGNGTLAYYLATACGRITLAPAGDLNLLGLFWDQSFYRGTLDKLKIEPDFYQAGRYKGTGEAFMRRDNSADAEESYAAVLDSLYGQIVEAMATARGLPTDAVAAIIDEAPYTSQEALAMGLVDSVAYPDAFREQLDDQLDGSSTWVDVDDYHRHRHGRGPVAVVFAQGTIVRGDGAYDPWTERRFIGSDEMQRLLERLAEDASVRAVVLRINSPGGSALASDLILRSVERLAAEKPVVVSMSNVAASGGYYIAARANRVVAEAATITGSIGVVFGKVATRSFEEELLGITHDSIQRGRQADYFSLLDRFSDEQAVKVRRMMQDTYDRFTAHVVDGRGLSAEAVENVAQGRIWTGQQAAELGLVDEIGGLEAAIAAAAREAEIDAEPTGIRLLPRAPSLWQFLERRQAVRIARLLKVSLPFSAPRGLEIPADAAALTSPF